MTGFIAGFGFTGYRSVRGDLQLVGPLEKVNLIAGQNNAGKSNVLRVAQQYMESPSWAPTGLDAPREPGASDFTIAFAQRIDEQEMADLFPEAWNKQNFVKQLSDILSQPEFRLTHDDLGWVTYKTEPATGERRTPRYLLDPGPLESVAPRFSQYFRDISNALTNRHGGGRIDDAARVYRTGGWIGSSARCSLY